MRFILILSTLLMCKSLHAQDKTTAPELNDQEVISIEDLYKNAPAPETVPVKVETSADEKKEIEIIQNSTEYKNSQIKNIVDLNTLAPFNDVSVIQKRFLPKTERLQLYGALGLTTNSPWFTNAGGKLNLSYHFTEKWGVELSGLFLSSSEKDSSKDIRNNNNLQPERFVLTKSNIGADIVWAPIYGKITSLNNEITPFDMYFSFGAGQSATNAQEKNVTTFHVATGQIFAISKSTAFRWDYSWYLYQATPQVDSLSSSPPVKNTYNDLVFTAGVSFFFPEAGYR